MYHVKILIKVYHKSFSVKILHRQVFVQDKFTVHFYTFHNKIKGQKQTTQVIKWEKRYVETEDTYWQ